ncbi:NADPH-dependent 7-cyano-7-deazaguanine reductase QueF [Psychrosphaera sp. B3R10]|uniref:NADPH-dependent 7-cyano-7-deazaguanine reductase QueF n=1 Tax=unclassified Psychrosphaera TaxID=2641570 RepID=UPI001C093083|nr:MULTISPECIES: NADPH-dependent 7-cyano-7-deazaguanine reductase QueF [unclassified Psychrosphaera]MBU2880938.1 NADPH-dependent 7-cyano-7-deazaguanine reductase QueF [Psychrosphaera sp. I2R16]MBU2990843.1 NADPH-dependent 7-cyano-7-deazaguanine reductase QueF [Psychrosphaera sp. B3R10]
MENMNDKYNESDILNELTLGKTTKYHDQYDAKLLQPVPRSLNRDQLTIPAAMPFYGHDLWTGYELSWLNPNGKPIVAIAEFLVPAISPNLIESKSFKLYLNSFNQTQFSDWEAVKETMAKDLSLCAGAPVNVELFDVSDPNKFQIQQLPGTNIDGLDITVTDYQYNDQLLSLADSAAKDDVEDSSDSSPKVVTETINSHLLKSNCLITNQPDWASIIISYTGSKICHESLLRYLISFRMHNEFHEQCVERIYCDIIDACNPSQLSVYARYTRRGGLDINPFRSSSSQPIEHNIRTHRQ